MRSYEHSIAVRYGLAISVCAVAIFIRWGLDPVLGSELPFATLFPAVAAAVCFGGAGPGLLATILGYVGVNYLFIEPRGTLQIAGVADFVGAGAYLCSSLIILLLGIAMRRARRDADEKSALARQEQHTVRQSEQRFSDLLQALPAAVYSCDAQGRVTMFNRAAASLWGREPQIQQDLWCGSWKIFRPDGSSLPLDSCPMAIALREGYAISGEEIVIERPDHTRRNVLANPQPMRDTTGRVVGAINMLIDVTEIKQAEAALRTSEERFRLLADTVPSIVWTAAPDGTITFASEQWYSYTGLSPEENARGWVDRVLHPDDRDRCVKHWTDALSLATQYSIEVRNRRHDGEYRWFLTRAVPVRDDSGTVVAWFGSSTDIHDYKTAQNALQDADRRKDDFLAMLGHELRNPLAPIRNAAQILSSSDPNERRWARDVIDRQSRHLVRLVDDLLDVSRITRGKIVLRRETIDLRSPVTQALEACRLCIENRRQPLEVCQPSHAVMVSADSARVIQIVQNLLNNASKFTPHAGRIRLAVECHGGEARIIVRDSGRGIAPQMLKRIFEPFAQADGMTDSAAGGLGIGLALVRNLADIHGGRVQASSDGPGKGSEFIVHLPLAQPSAASGRIPRTSPTTAGRQPQQCSLRILVVDDHEDSARSMTRLLRLWGHDSRAVNNGFDAIQVVREYLPNVVLLDIGLPGMSGYDVARAFRAEADFRDTLLVAMTGYGQDDDRQRARESGFDHHLVKPIDLSVLQDLLRSRNGRGAAAALPVATGP